MGGFTFSGLGNYIANTVVADLFRTTRCNDVLRRVLTLNLLFPITQTLAFVSVAFWGNGNIRNIKNKVVNDLPQAYLVSFFVLSPLSYMQGRFVSSYWRQWTSFIQGSEYIIQYWFIAFWNMWLSSLNVPQHEYKTVDDYLEEAIAWSTNHMLIVWYPDKRKRNNVRVGTVRGTVCFMYV